MKAKMKYLLFICLLLCFVSCSNYTKVSGKNLKIIEGGSYHYNDYIKDDPVYDSEANCWVAVELKTNRTVKFNGNWIVTNE